MKAVANPSAGYVERVRNGYHWAQVAGVNPLLAALQAVWYAWALRNGAS